MEGFGSHDELLSDDELANVLSRQYSEEEKLNEKPLSNRYDSLSGAYFFNSTNRD